MRLGTVRWKHGDTVNDVAWSPDGTQVMSGSNDKTVVLWDVGTGKRIRTFEGHSGAVFSISISPDGRQVVSGSYDNSLILWDVETGRRIRTFEGHSGAVSSVSISPDGKQVVSGGGDETLIIWDVESGRKLAVLRGHLGPVNAVRYSPTGRRIISGSWDATVLVWHPFFIESREARRWMAELPSEGRKGNIAEVIKELPSEDYRTYCRARERILALREEGIEALLKAYPSVKQVAESFEARKEELLRKLEDADREEREKARQELIGYGRAASGWVREQLKRTDLSAKVKDGLRWVWREMEKKGGYEMADIGRVRAVLALIEMLPNDTAREALAEYAQGPMDAYAAHRARGALKVHGRPHGGKQGAPPR